MKIVELAFTGYPVTDMERARAFYEGVLKLEPTRIVANGHWIEYDLGHSTFALSNMSKEEWKPSSDGPAVAFEVEDFDAAIAMDNALPHMKGVELESAVVAIASTLKPDGVFVASIRDYDRLVAERPAAQPPAFYGTQGNRRIVHQVWDWRDERTYTPHLYITREVDGGWATLHVAGVYYCILRSELTAILHKSGFREIRWLMPEQSHFYQPIVVARR